MDNPFKSQEQCVGCGIYATQHPVAAVMTDDGQAFYQKGMCQPCFQDPSHRRTVVKASYFIRGVHDIDHAISMAGERDSYGNPTPTPPSVMRRLAKKLGL